jgi:hypothetical protein
MSAKSLIITSRAAAPAEPGQAVARGVLFELPRAKNFIEKSLSEDTRRAYTRALLDFFSFIRKESPLAQTDDNPDRVSEVFPRFTTYFVSQIINLSDADGEIVIHLDIESASQRKCECIIRRCNNKSTRTPVFFARPSKQGVNKWLRLSSTESDTRTE